MVATDDGVVMDVACVLEGLSVLPGIIVPDDLSVMLDGLLVVNSRIVLDAMIVLNGIDRLSCTVMADGAFTVDGIFALDRAIAMPLLGVDFRTVLNVWLTGKATVANRVLLGGPIDDSPQPNVVAEYSGSVPIKRKCSLSVPLPPYKSEKKQDCGRFQLLQSRLVKRTPRVPFGETCASHAKAT